MKINYFKFLGLAVLAIIFAVSSCQDEFSEEDFLRLQAELAEDMNAADHTRRLEEIAALHQNALALQDDEQAHAEALQQLSMELEQAMTIWELTVEDSIADAEALKELRANRLIFAYTVNIYEGGNPVEGVSVTMSNQVEETSAGRMVTGTTDANGSVTFNNVAVGTSTVRLSKDGYIPASYQVWFDLSGPTNNTNANEFRTEYSDVPLFALSADGSSTGTIRGQVSVETNLTNETSEVPEGIMIRADFSDLTVSGIQESDDINVYNYVLQSSSNIGNATVGADGMFEMIVPARASGQRINLIIPSFTKDQVLAITKKEGQMVDAQYDTIPVLFGPSVDESNIPFVSGAKAVFPEPTAMGGSGLAFNVTKLAAGLGTWTNTNPIGENDYNGPDPGVDYDYQLLTRGAGYKTSPTITLTGGEGTGAEMLASLEGYFSSLTLTNAGEGYTASSSGWAYIYMYGVDDNGDTLKNNLVNQVQITTDADGKVEAFDLNDLWNTEGDPNGSNPIETDDYGVEGYRVTKWVVEIDGPGTPTTEATATVDVDMKIDRIKMYKGGSGYTSAPTVAFTGGGASEQATFEFSDFQTHWVVTLDNTNSEGYTMLPANIYYEYFPEDDDPSTNDDIYPVEAGEVQGSQNIETLLEVEGDVIAWKIPAKTYVTREKSTEAPNFVVVDQVAFPAMMGVEITDGKVTDLYRYNNDDTNSDGEYDAYGNGYGSPFSVEIMPAFTGAPGSGAKIELLYGYTTSSGEYQWEGDFDILNPGSGYLENLNVASKENFNTSSISGSSGSYYVIVSPGETISVEINYGTGEQLVEVDGE